MRNTSEPMEAFLQKYFSSQTLAVLATAGSSGPYASLMSVAVTPDLGHVLFVTEERSRKYSNMTENREVALLFDNRCESGGALQQTVAVTGLGFVETLHDRKKEPFLEMFLSVHPHLESTARAPSSVLVRMMIRSWLVVGGFSNVEEYVVSGQ